MELPGVCVELLLLGSYWSSHEGRQGMGGVLDPSSNSKSTRLSGEGEARHPPLLRFDFKFTMQPIMYSYTLSTSSFLSSAACPKFSNSLYLSCFSNVSQTPPLFVFLYLDLSYRYSYFTDVMSYPWIRPLFTSIMACWMVYSDDDHTVYSIHLQSII